MGYGGKLCNVCDVEDDETHRINACVKFGDLNRYRELDKIDFEMIYSDDWDKVMPVICSILSIWDLEHGRNKIKES